MRLAFQVGSPFKAVAKLAAMGAFEYVSRSVSSLICNEFGNAALVITGGGAIAEFVLRWQFRRWG